MEDRESVVDNAPTHTVAEDAGAGTRSTRRVTDTADTTAAAQTLSLQTSQFTATAVLQRRPSPEHDRAAFHPLSHPSFAAPTTTIARPPPTRAKSGAGTSGGGCTSTMDPTTRTRSVTGVDAGRNDGGDVDANRSGSPYSRQRRRVHSSRSRFTPGEEDEDAGRWQELPPATTCTRRSSAGWSSRNVPNASTSTILVSHLDNAEPATVVARADVNTGADAAAITTTAASTASVRQLDSTPLTVVRTQFSPSPPLLLPITPAVAPHVHLSTSLSLPTATNPSTVVTRLTAAPLESGAPRQQQRQQQQPSPQRSRLPRFQPARHRHNSTPRGPARLSSPPSAQHPNTAAVTNWKALSNQLYRLLRLCFLRRWTWHMWSTCVRAYGGRRVTRSGGEYDDEDGYDRSRGRGRDGGEDAGLVDGGYDDDDDDDDDDVYDAADEYLEPSTLSSGEHTTDVLHRHFYGGVEEETRRGGGRGGRGGDDDDRGFPSLEGAARGAAAAAAASSSSLQQQQQLPRTAAMGETRRRGRGWSSVSPSGRRDRRDRRRGGRAADHHTSNSAFLRTKDFSLVEGCRLCLTFCCCCCCHCCRGWPCHCGNAWIVRLLHALRILWARHRAVAWCLLAVLAVLHCFVVLPLVASGAAALMENEDLFVQRMLFFGLPREVDALTTPRAVLVQLVFPTILDEMEGNPNVVRTAVADAETAGALRAHAAGVARQALHLTFAQRFLPAAVPWLGSPTLQPSQLPSWTLFSIEKDCQECIEVDGYAAAVAGADAVPPRSIFTSTKKEKDKGAAAGVPTRTQRQPLPPPSSSILQQGVFATSSAPLGRIGPMLLAIASVTDDVAVVEELRKWPWIPHVARRGELLRGAQRGAPPAHLAVLGIPSTDHPARAALRDGQRTTWLSYSDVARAENGFTGKLLALFIFSASEPPHVRADPRGTTTEKTAAAPFFSSWRTPDPLAKYISRDARRLGDDVSLMLPTVADFTAAAEYYALTSVLARQEKSWTTATKTAAAAARPPAAWASSYMQRRMTLRRDWQRTDSADSPCDTLTAKTYSMNAHTFLSTRNTSSPLSFIAEYLELPVHPLFTVPAHLVCYASTALWQEALAHRNMVWVDMMTDRRPSSKKKLGEGGGWGLPVEVGMSQKLVLWLEYAYHAFPDVSYIMKGDDDTYLKVPQFLNDIRYIQSGRRGRALEELTHINTAATTGTTTVTSTAATTGKADNRGVAWVRGVFGSTKPAENYLLVRSTEECVYWGSMRRWNGEVYFGAGMLFLLHRRLVQTVLEERAEYNNDVVRLAAQDYSPRHAHSYFAAMMDHEDVMLGKMLAERRVRSMQLCPFRRSWYVGEYWDRFHDVHSGRAVNVTWSTVAAHRCTPADLPFLHYYFQHEYEYDDAAVNASAAAYGARAAADATTHNDLPAVRWREPREMNHTRLPFVRAAKDDVAVYEVEYSPFADGALVLDGWVSNTQRRNEHL
ncbi:phosphoglycan beta 13 galactosyltransferase putativephosphogly [Leptomonas pyrrhocoris]|uniref:Phosphoglycan beta 13 galactosyltransferase putativephosphogly n=1 Tax=Leptomonas pyrrhocoris TaxID=157538 RepID=A0A0M9FS66_LEPPY|nr:phosphoglycan beta 13 galactosyltransferase putativephosphogly [Leptomonas pyrrhocoris]XP_015653336.1 phosphoglycan beta 13 galactosyltransferase putativephosphogly [Leptomonas pyrrhocoris]KPA74896.1 phosphoglycan beta 13 galactosyltransferase putativephosphogly [Leptomonas pyrrhocoris]KPA74897.1 phosphoglycan beta 13 galactosyltransferase putativephosphogly [Leptomonas pyrrhocoris]|eukprot:XP_015653335.1 phosphoglycan beta 13 galactosyltransferase putativephosphogly [Leptomonas pyrrhocoris]